MADIHDAQLVIVRGLPGSGKSTLAREISNACGHLHFENDMFFETENGYAYDASKVVAAQKWCFRATRDAVLAGKKVVVSNVFTKVAHMGDFLKLSDSAMVIECRGNYGNVHDVPAGVLQRMEASWEPLAGAIQLSAPTRVGR